MTNYSSIIFNTYLEHPSYEEHLAYGHRLSSLEIKSKEMVCVNIRDKSIEKYQETDKIKRMIEEKETYLSVRWIEIIGTHT